MGPEDLRDTFEQMSADERSRIEHIDEAKQLSRVQASVIADFTHLAEVLLPENVRRKRERIVMRGKLPGVRSRANEVTIKLSDDYEVDGWGKGETSATLKAYEVLQYEHTLVPAEDYRTAKAYGITYTFKPHDNSQEEHVVQEWFSGGQPIMKGKQGDALFVGWSVRSNLSLEQSGRLVNNMRDYIEPLRQTADQTLSMFAQAACNEKLNPTLAPRLRAVME